MKGIIEGGLFVTITLLEVIYSIGCMYYYGIRSMGCDMRGENTCKYDKLLYDNFYYIGFNMKELYRVCIKNLI